MERSPSCKRIPHESYEIIPLKNVLVRRTIDNRRGNPFMNLAGTRMNRVGKGDSVKRGVGRLWSTDANEQRKLQRNQSYGYNIKYYNIHLYVLYVYILFILCIV